MQQVSIQQLVSVSIARGATTPNPGGPAIVWSTTSGGALLWNGTSWDTTASETTLRTLAGLNTFGFLVREFGTGDIVSRTLAGTPGQIQIADGNGVQNPSVALTNTGIVPGRYPTITVDAQGRAVTGGPLTALDMPSDYINLYKERYNSGAKPSAGGSNSVAIGVGAQTLGENSIALGEQSIARHKGSMVRAAGRFQTSGDAQVGCYILKAVTTNNFQKELFLDGPSGTTPLILPDESTWTFVATITAHQTDGTNGHAGFIFKGVVYRKTGASSVAFQGVPIFEVLGRSDLTWTINTNANGANGSLSFIVRGESGKMIRWVASVQTVEITN